jgi:hypothetical protein
MRLLYHFQFTLDLNNAKDNKEEVLSNTEEEIYNTEEVLRIPIVGDMTYIRHLKVLNSNLEYFSNFNFIIFLLSIVDSTNLT